MEAIRGGKSPSYLYVPVVGQILCEADAEIGFY